jgi:cytochrome c biogenesis protein CcmG/thiol:disulfide interchange protein DsbE
VAKVVAAVAVAGGMAVAVLVAALGNNPAFDPIAVLGRPAPQVQLAALDGGTFDLTALRGKAVLVNFWNSWCGPCRQEAPSIAAFNALHRDDPDYVMIGIVRDDTREAVAKWTAKHDLGWRVVFDRDDRAALDFGTTGQPETYAVSPSGVIVAKRSGPAKPADLERLLELARSAR